MKNIFTLLLVFTLSNTVFSQEINFDKMKEVYEARQPSLDSMGAYPNHEYQNLVVKNTDNVNISFWWIPKRKNAGTIILVHGFMMNKSYMLKKADAYLKKNMNVILMDLRARGQSGGDRTTSGPEIREDVLAVIEYYSKNLKDFGELSLHGYSHGGRAVLFAAEKSKIPIKSIVLESIPYSLEESFKRTYNIKKVPPMNAGNIDQALNAISGIPVLILYGSNDTAVIEKEINLMTKLLNNPKTKAVKFNNAGHDLSVDLYWDKYLKTIAEFFGSL